MNSIFQAGRNCTYLSHCNRARILVDGDEYFRAFVQVASKASHSIIVLAWDFDSRTLLNFDKKPDLPAQVGDFLNHLARRRRALNIYVLDWDYPMLYGTDREAPPLFNMDWQPHRRVHFRYDSTHPVGGSHHQKIAVIDDAVAFVGGIDLTSRRWDTCEHTPDDPRRLFNGNPYPPFHDLMAMVDGDAARDLAVIARERWQQATRCRLVPTAKSADIWPEELEPEITNVAVGISRTLPERENQPEVREIEALYLDAIAAAKRSIYIENQYFTAHKIGDALAARLGEKEGPEVVIVSRLLSHGWLEEHTMTALRTRLIKQLHDADRWKRLGMYYPHIDGLCEGTCEDVHSKVMIVDDEWLRVGSANICNRSMGVDSECDLTFEAAGSTETASAIAAFRNRLLGEHLHVEPSRVADECAKTGSLVAAIQSLQQREGRSLRELEAGPEISEPILELASVADPERPVSLDNLISQFAPRTASESGGPAWKLIALIALVVGGLTALWRFTPLADLITPEHVVVWAREAGGHWWAPLVVIAAYTPACLVMFPRPLITLFSVMAFGPQQAFIYALVGVLAAGLLTYVAGRAMNRDMVRRLAGPKLNHISDVLRRRGLIAVTSLRLVPVAPFAAEGIIAGAIRIKLWHFMLGTGLGLLPGTIGTTVLGNELEAVLMRPSEANYWVVAGIAVFFFIGFLVVRRVFSDGALAAPHSQ